MSASWLPNNANLLHFAAVAWWVAVALLLYVYAGYPLLLAALALFSRRRRPEPGCLPTLSILIAAHNEEAGIEKKLEQTLTLDYPPTRWKSWFSRTARPIAPTRLWNPSPIRACAWC